MNIDQIKNEIDLLNKELDYKKFNELMNNYFNLFRNTDSEQIQKINEIFLNLKDKRIYFSLKNDSLEQNESIVLLSTKKRPNVNNIVPILRKKLAKLIPENDDDIAFFSSARQLNEAFYYIDDLEIETLNELFNQISNNLITLNDCNKYGIDGNSLEIDIQTKTKIK